MKLGKESANRLQCHLQPAYLHVSLYQRVAFPDQLTGTYLTSYGASSPDTQRLQVRVCFK